MQTRRQADALALNGQKTRPGQLAGLALTRSEMKLKLKFQLDDAQTPVVNASLSA